MSVSGKSLVLRVGVRRRGVLLAAGEKSKQTRRLVTCRKQTLRTSHDHIIRLPSARLESIRLHFIQEEKEEPEKPTRSRFATTLQPLPTRRNPAGHRHYHKCYGSLLHVCSHRAGARTRVRRQAAFDATLGVLLLLMRRVLLAHVWRVRGSVGAVADGHADAYLNRVLNRSGRVRAKDDKLTKVSNAVFELSTRSSSNRMTPGSNSSRIVLPPNLK